MQTETLDIENIRHTISALVADADTDLPRAFTSFLDSDSSTLDFRGAISPEGQTSPNSFSGRIISGTPAAGTKVRLLPGGQELLLTEINGNKAEETVFVFSEPLEIKKIQLIVPSAEPATVGHQLQASIIWIDSNPLFPGRSYYLQNTIGKVEVSITAIKYLIKSDSAEKLAAKTLEKNQAGECNLSVVYDIAFDAVNENPFTGGFVLRDKQDDRILGIGGINYALRRSDNITIQHVDVNKEARSTMKGQKPCVVWLTGLSGAGKSTIANILEKKLHAEGKHTYLLDGDNVRHGLNKDLGFTDEDRVENIRRIAEVAKLMVDAGLIVVTAFISPFRSERKMARDLLEEGDFIEVHVDTPLDVAEQRDVKGLYKKARSGQLKNFTGIDSPYEAPEHPECSVQTAEMSAEEAADVLLGELKTFGKI